MAALRGIAVGAVLLPARVATAGFEAVWNGPWPQDCGNSTPGLEPSSFDLQRFGIAANAGNAWWGDRIQCRYCGAPQDDVQCPGLWPYFVGDKAYHGGIPQAGNLTQHAAQVAADVRRFTAADFDGLLAIDMENWYPFPLSSQHAAYITASEARVKRQHPSWGAAAVSKQAGAEWGKAAVEWWATVLRVTRAVRPKARVGFYNFPSCYAGFSAAADPPGCTATIQAMNDGLLDPILREATVFLPSVYLEWGRGPNASAADKFEDTPRYVQDNLAEALRVRRAQNRPDVAVYAYTMWQSTSDPKEESEPIRTLPRSELAKELNTSRLEGVDGVVLYSVRPPYQPPRLLRGPE